MIGLVANYTLHLWFHYPDGGVWSNIVASFIWASPLWIGGFIVGRGWHKHLLKKHEELHAKVHDLQASHDSIHEKLDAIHKKQHEQVRSE